MRFPSAAMKAWCRNVERLRRELARAGKAREDGFCQCQVGAAIALAPRDQQAQLCSPLFWSIWIDQVMYSIAPDSEFYKTFRRLYRFPKLYSHPTPGHASPAFLLNKPERGATGRGKPSRGPSELDNIDFGDRGAPGTGEAYRRPGKRLLLQDKREFWGEVAAWLEHVHRHDILLAAESDFRKDVRQRFPAGSLYLFE